MIRKLNLPKVLILGFGLLVLLAWSVPGALAAPLPGGTLDPLTIPKYVTPLVIPPVMNHNGTADNYDIAVRQFQQQILPAPLPPTTLWSYGPAADPVPAVAAPDPLSQFNYPAYTIETTSGTPVNVQWINDLVAIDPLTGFPATPRTFLPHLLPIDQTLHWANPTNAGCRDTGKVPQTDCATNDPLQYTGPVPIVTHLHGAHVQPDSDGYPEAWWLPAASDIPVGYATSGTLFNDSTGTNLGNTGSALYSYQNDNSATTLWYHDHTLGMTRSNVYAGPAGFWLIRGGAYDGATDGVGGPLAVLPGPAPVAGQTVLQLNVPSTPTVPNPIRNSIREIPIVIQDRSFDTTGSLFYPASRTFFDGYPGPYTGSAISTDIAPTWNPEAFFNTMVVNGVTWPTLQVAPALYRLRLLNGCNSRFLNLAMFEVVLEKLKVKKGKKKAGQIRQMTRYGIEHPFYQIGAEQGFLDTPVMISTGFATTLPGDGTIPATVPAADPQQALLMGLAERADVIVDFRNLPTGTRIRMINAAPDAPFGGFPDIPADPATTGQVMEFVVNSLVTVAADANTTPPENLVLNAKPGITGTFPVTDVSLNEEESAQVCVTVTPAGAITVTAVSPTPLLPGVGPGSIGAFCAAQTPPSVPMAPVAAVLGTVDKATIPGTPLGVPLKWTANGVGVMRSVTVPSGTVNVWVTENPGLNTTEDWDIYNFTVDAHPIHIHLVEFEVINRVPIPGVVPAPIPVGLQPWETGFKDTVIAYPGEITKVRAHFDIAGLYVWHCHIVEHEDNEMMRPYFVGP